MKYEYGYPPPPPAQATFKTVLSDLFSWTRKDCNSELLGTLYTCSIYRVGENPDLSTQYCLFVFAVGW